MKNKSHTINYFPPSLWIAFTQMTQLLRNFPSSVLGISKDCSNSMTLSIYSLLFLLSICSESNYLGPEGKT